MQILSDKIFPLDSQARLVLDLASDIATAYNHAVLDSVHILCALSEIEGDVQAVLEKLNITKHKVKHAILIHIGYGTSHSNQDISDSLLELLGRAMCLGSNSITPLHLLEAITYEEEGIAKILLEKMNVDITELQGFLKVYQPSVSLTS